MWTATIGSAMYQGWNCTYLADTGVNLRLAQERWPKVQFHATREHGQQLS